MRHVWIKHLVHDFEYNHKFQFHFHLWMMLFWILNAIAGTVIMILDQSAWLTIGVYYVFIISIYANWDTDYDAVSASQSAMHAQELLDRDNNESNRSVGSSGNGVSGRSPDPNGSGGSS